MVLQDRYIPLREAAKRLGISRTKLWSMVRNGDVEVRPDPLDRRQRLVSVQAIDTLLADRALEAGPKRSGTKRFISDGIEGNPNAVPSDRIKEWVRETWHRRADA